MAEPTDSNQELRANMEEEYKTDLVSSGEYAEAVTLLTEYCDAKLSNLISMMVNDVLSVRPENPALQMLGFLEQFVENNPDYFSNEAQALPVMTVLGPDGQPQHTGRPHKRRSGVSAECMAADAIDVSPARVIPKTPEEELEIRRALATNILFRDIAPSQIGTVVASMRKLTFHRGDAIITQGDDGNTFYVLASGSCDCLIRTDDRQVTCVKQYSPGGSFGELALLYGTPRAASIVITSDTAEAWEVDRETFRKVIMTCAFRQRDRYFEFLREAPFLDPLSNDQVAKIADVVEEVAFRKGDRIIVEHDTRDKCFYMLLSGTCDVYKQFHPDRPASLVLSYRSGDYFGELALLSNSPRAASVIATSDAICLRLDRHDFERLLGPVQDVLSTQVEAYDRVNTEMRRLSALQDAAVGARGSARGGADGGADGAWASAEAEEKALGDTTEEEVEDTTATGGNATAGPVAMPTASPAAASRAGETSAAASGAFASSSTSAGATSRS